MAFREQLEFLLSVSGVAAAAGELKGFSDSADREGEKAARSWDDMGGKLQKVGLGLTAGVTAPLIAGFGAAAKAAVEDADATSRLAEALRGAAGATDAQVESTEAWISKQLESKGFTDDQLRPAIERAVRSTKDLGEAQGIVTVAMDIATRTGKSLEEVTAALGKASDGQLKPLRDLGVELKDGEGKARAFDDVLAELNVTFGGASAAAADTTAGKMKIANAQFGEAVEMIGANLLPVMGTLAEVAGSVSGAFAGMSPEMQKVIVYSGLALAAIGPLTTAFGTAMRGAEKLAGALGHGATGKGVAAALGGVTAAIAIAVVAWQVYASKQRENEDRARSFGEALRAEAEGISGGVEALIASSVAHDNLSRALEAAKAPASELTAAIKAGSDEFAIAITNIESHGTSAIVTGNQLSALTKSMIDNARAAGISDMQMVAMLRELDALADAADDNTEATNEQSTALAALEDQTAGTAAAYRHLGEASRATTDETEKAVVVGDTYAEVQRINAEVIEQSTRALEDYERQLSATLDPTINAEQATIRNRQAIEALTEKTREAAAEDGISAQEKDELRLATLDLISATADQVDKMVEANQVSDTAAARKAALLYLLGVEQAATGDATGALAEYIAKVKEIPASTTHMITLDTSQADRSLADYVRRVRESGELVGGSPQFLFGRN